LAILSRKISLLEDNISRIKEVEVLTSKRISLGDETAYAKLIVEQQRVQLEQQIIQFQLEKNQQLYSLQQLVGWNGELNFDDTAYTFNYNAVRNEDFSNSELRMAKLEQEFIQSNGAILQQQKKPTLEFSFNNMSIIGNQNITGTDVYYGPSSRFTSLGAAIVLPTDRKKQNAYIASNLMDLDVQMLNTKLLEQQFSARLNTLFEQLQKVNEQLLSLSQWSKDSEQAQAISTQITKQFETGNVNYMEWSWNLQNLMQMQLNYWSALQLKNNTLIEIEFIKEK
jgi:cobalt-zinc-cadmium resistance protein CzcA